jgi:flagellar protein FlbT
MPLKLRLKAGERVIIGNALVSNPGNTCELIVENHVPVLRGKHVMSERAATTPCRQIYFAIQMLYLESTPNLELQNHILALIRSVANAAPSMIPLLSSICDELVADRSYSALQLAQDLIVAETGLIRNEKSGVRTRQVSRSQE